MQHIQKSPPAIPNLAKLYLIPVENIEAFHPPIVYMPDADDVVQFDFAPDSLSFTQTPKGTRQPEAFLISFTGFVAGITQQNNANLTKAATRRYVVIATDYNNKTWLAGSPTAPFRISFNQNLRRVGYNITLTATCKYPLQYVSVLYPDINPPSPVSMVNIRLTTNPNTLPSNMVQGQGDYPETSWVVIFATQSANIQGIGNVNFVKWQSYPPAAPETIQDVTTENTHGFVASTDLVFVAVYEIPQESDLVVITFSQDGMNVQVPPEWLTGAGTYNKHDDIITIEAVATQQLPDDGPWAQFVEWLSYPAGQPNLLAHHTYQNPYSFQAQEDTVFVPLYHEFIP